jgi:hypothetical protein
MELFYYSVYGIMGLFLLAILIMVIKTTIEIKKSEKELEKVKQKYDMKMAILNSEKEMINVLKDLFNANWQDMEEYLENNYERKGK